VTVGAPLLESRPRPRPHRLDHARYLLARHPGDAGGGGELIAELVFESK